MTYEHLKLCLDDEACIDLLFDAIQNLGQARTPTEISDAFMMSRLTALTNRAAIAEALPQRRLSGVYSLKHWPGNTHLKSNMLALSSNMPCPRAKP